MKLAVVTGAAQGIGRRTAEILAGAGYSLALLDLQSCSSTLAALRAVGCEAADFPGDLSDESVVEATAEAIRTRWNRVDVLVNNAGISSIAPAETIEAQDLSPSARGQPGRAISIGSRFREDDVAGACRQHRECGVHRRD